MPQNTRSYIHYLKITPTYGCVYQRPLSEDGQEISSTRGHNLSQDRSKAYGGKMSEGSKKRLKKAINLLIECAEWKTAISPDKKKQFRFKVAFWTLTLPSAQLDYSDKQIKKFVLEPFLRIARQKWGVKSYVWRAEKQKNGNIHYHLLVDQFVNLYYIRNTWNKCLSKLDFIDRFEEKHGHRNPNSTDVHSVHEVDDLAAYMVKYMSKDEKEAQTIEGRLWDCSQNLKAKDSCTLVIDSQVESFLDEAGKDEKIEVKETDHATLYFWKSSRFLSFAPSDIKKEWFDYIDRIKNHLPPIDHSQKIRDFKAQHKEASIFSPDQSKPTSTDIMTQLGIFSHPEQCPF